MATLKNCHSPAGMRYSNAGASLATLTDCPACKHGTLDMKDQWTMKCADCGAEHRMNQSRGFFSPPKAP